MRKLCFWGALALTGACGQAVDPILQGSGSTGRLGTRQSPDDSAEQSNWPQDQRESVVALRYKLDAYVADRTLTELARAETEAGAAVDVGDATFVLIDTPIYRSLTLTELGHPEMRAQASDVTYYVTRHIDESSASNLAATLTYYTPTVAIRSVANLHCPTLSSLPEPLNFGTGFSIGAVDVTVELGDTLELELRGDQSYSYRATVDSHGGVVMPPQSAPPAVGRYEVALHWSQKRSEVTHGLAIDLDLGCTGTFREGVVSAR
jgi:hypothetical protein